MYVNGKEEINITGVSYRFVSGGKKHPRAKRYPYVYGYTDTGRLVSWRIRSYMVPFFKLQCKKVTRHRCAKCLSLYMVFGDPKDTGCPVCAM